MSPTLDPLSLSPQHWSATLGLAFYIHRHLLTTHSPSVIYVNAATDILFSSDKRYSRNGGQEDESIGLCAHGSQTPDSKAGEDSENIAQGILPSKPGFHWLTAMPFVASLLMPAWNRTFSNRATA